MRGNLWILWKTQHSRLWNLWTTLRRALLAFGAFAILGAHEVAVDNHSL